MSNTERWLDENTREVVAASDYDRAVRERDHFEQARDRLDARLQQLQGAVARAEEAERQLAIVRRQRDECHRERNAAEAEIERLTGGQCGE